MALLVSLVGPKVLQPFLAAATACRYVSFTGSQFVPGSVGLNRVYASYITAFPVSFRCPEEMPRATAPGTSMNFARAMASTGTRMP